MTIEWTKVTWYSQLFAVILFVLVFSVGYWIGQSDSGEVEEAPAPAMKNDFTFICADGKSILALFSEGQVELMLSDGRSLILHHAVSASGARYANEDESIVFWNKGTSAWLVEGAVTTFDSCEESPLPV